MFVELAVRIIIILFLSNEDTYDLITSNRPFHILITEHLVQYAWVRVEPTFRVLS